jgi:DNA-binding NtrC family response regulator
LRGRAEDIPLLADHFLQRYRRELGMGVRHISPEALQTLGRHNWPGNVRELENAIKFALVHSTGDVVTPQALPASVRGQSGGVPALPAETQQNELSDVRQLVRNLLSKGTADLKRRSSRGRRSRALGNRSWYPRGGATRPRAAEILGAVLATPCGRDCNSSA